MVRTYDHPDTDEVKLTQVMFALSDAIRLAMIRLLAERGTLNAIDLADGMNMPKSSITHHSKLLREAGVTRTTAEGRHCYISLRRDLLDARFPGLLDAIINAEPET